MRGLVFRSPFKSLALIASFLLGACGASSEFYTQTLSRDFSEPKKILVVESSVETPAVQRLIMEAFHTALIGKFKTCSVTADYVHTLIEPINLSLDNREKDDKTNIQNHIHNFAPDFLLTVRGSLYDTRSFRLELVNISQRKTVWNGKIILEHAGFFSGTDVIGDRFAGDLVRQLQKDGVLKNCPAVAKDQQ